jgi:hypothetical protein
MLQNINARLESTEYITWVHANALLTSAQVYPRYEWASRIVSHITEHSKCNGFAFVYNNSELTEKFIQWVWRMYKEDTSILYRAGGNPNWVVPKLVAGHRNYAEYIDAYEGIFGTDFSIIFMDKWRDSNMSERLHMALASHLTAFFYSYLSMDGSRSIREIERAHEDMMAAAAAEDREWGEDGGAW